MDDKLFDSISEQELTYLRERLDERDPDELECELSMGVLTISFPDGARFVINSHRAAGQIWMAAFKLAWHFTPNQEGGRWIWRTDKDELRATLSRVLTEKVGQHIPI